MSHAAFGEFFPAIAGKETRVVTILKPYKTGLPQGQYAFIELYCTDPECDCRNVYIHVANEDFPGPLATITYGWEPLTYYKQWMGADEEDEMLADFKGPALAFGSRQSQFSKEWLDIFSDILQTDKAYAGRLKSHYEKMKAFIKDQKQH